jgi:hypothetical protein
MEEHKMAKESWLNRLARSLDAAGGDALRQEILQGSETLSSGSSPASKTRWVRGMLERMEGHFDYATCLKVMSACSCAYPQALIRRFGKVYEVSGSLQNLVSAMREEQRQSILLRIGADDELRNRVDLEPFMDSPVLCDDGSILHTGPPYHPREYMLAKDAQTRRRHLCHCGWINGGREDISPVYCGCSTGFYRTLWESLLGPPVEVQVESTVFSGGQYCRMRVKFILP